MSLFKALHEETGMKNIVEVVLEQAEEDQVNILKGEPVTEDKKQVFISKYATWLMSLIEPSYYWYKQDVLKSRQ